MNYAGYLLPRYYLSFKSSSRSRPTTSTRASCARTRRFGGRLRPPTLTDDLGLDILEGTDSNGKNWYENRPRRRASIATDEETIKRCATTRDPDDWWNTTAERTYPTYDWSRAAGARAGGIAALAPRLQEALQPRVEGLVRGQGEGRRSSRPR